MLCLASTSANSEASCRSRSLHARHIDTIGSHQSLAASFAKRLVVQSPKCLPASIKAIFACSGFHEGQSRLASGCKSCHAGFGRFCAPFGSRMRSARRKLGLSRWLSVCGSNDLCLAFTSNSCLAYEGPCGHESGLENRTLSVHTHLMTGCCMILAFSLLSGLRKAA